LELHCGDVRRAQRYKLYSAVWTSSIHKNGLRLLGGVIKTFLLC